MTKTRNGRAVLDHLLSELDYLDALAGLSRDQVLFDPDAAYTHFVQISNATAKIRRRIREELSPLLERVERNAAQAALPDRVAALEAELAELRTLVEGRPRITPLRKEGG